MNLFLMKLALLKNPYTSGDEEVPCHHVQVNIESSEYNKVYRGLPFHGLQDSFFATLYQKFIELTEEELPLGHDLDSEEVLVDLLNRLRLKPKNTTPAFAGATKGESNAH